MVDKKQIVYYNCVVVYKYKGVYIMQDNEIIILSRNLRFIKSKYKLTQKQMAEICGIGVPSMSKLLKNQLPPRVGVECLF